MADVENSVLRRFVTDRFVQQTLDREARDLRLAAVVAAGSSASDFPLGAELTLLAVGPLVESRGWLEIGRQIGYFDQIPPFDSVYRELAVRAAGFSGEGSWPDWFRNFAAELGKGNVSNLVQEHLSLRDPAILSLFQAAFILADGFGDSLIASLQSSLQLPKSVLDNEEAQTSSKEVFAAIEGALNDDSDSQASLARCVGGFMQLIDLLGAFDSLFSGLDDVHGFRVIDRRVVSPSQPDAEVRDRLALATTTANLLTWRLNLVDERTVGRLHAVSEVFWDLCEREFARYPNLSIRWSAIESRREMVQMLERWRSRARPGGFFFSPDLEVFGAESKLPTSQAERDVLRQEPPRLEPS
jgi:hypothetical protein